MTDNILITIDLGNSFCKVGFFKKNEIFEILRVSWDELTGDTALYNRIKELKGIYSSVVSDEKNALLEEKFPFVMAFNNYQQLPITTNYETPDTLGKDRLCNAVGAWAANPSNNTLVIDVGTCIKYDFVSHDGVYQGGAISPGMRLRYKSLNDYTAKLPLLEETSAAKIIGKSTKQSIHSGVINGMHAEMLFLMEQYRRDYKDLTIFVTGGDSKFFNFDTVEHLIINENLTLQGLYKIYEFNA